MEYRIFYQGDKVETVDGEVGAEMRASQIAYSRDVDEQEVVWFEKDSDLEIARYLRDANDLSYESIRDPRCYGRSKDHPGAEPPKQLAENDFETTDDDEDLEERSCDSGYCFI